MPCKAASTSSAATVAAGLMRALGGKDRPDDPQQRTQDRLERSMFAALSAEETGAHKGQRSKTEVTNGVLKLTLGAWVDEAGPCIRAIDEVSAKRVAPPLWTCMTIARA